MSHPRIYVVPGRKTNEAAASVSRNVSLESLFASLMISIEF